MDNRKWQLAASASAPAVEPTPSVGYPTDGNPATATSATIPGARWFHQVGEEIRAVITGAGLTPDDTNLSQLSLAIASLVSGAQKSVIISGATFNTGVANGNAVYWDSANSRFDLALADGSSKQDAVGLADITNSKVYAFGVCALLSGLTPGKYYLSGTTAGAITATAPTSNVVKVGIARTATELDVDIDAFVTKSPQIQSITASVASNALTLGLNPTSLDFRSATLTNGAPNTRTVSAALSLVVPSGATLGTANAIAARLALLAIDNAGTVELATVNLAGGNNLDETTLISTTAISAAATAANVIYSATARTNVPFRVVGFIDITEATAGTWATAPTTIQGIGGQALASMSSLGYGQTWQDVTASRAINTTYYNTTGRPIAVFITGSNNAAVCNVILTVSGIQVTGAYAAINQVTGSEFIIPPGASYIVQSAAANINALYQWRELR